MDTVILDVLKKVPYSDEAEELLKRWLPEGTAARTVIVGVVAGVVVYYVTKKRYKLPPGPRGWPLLGNLLDFRNNTIYMKLIEWSKHYGPVVRFHVGREAIVGLNTIEVVLEALVKKGPDFAGRVQSYSGLQLSDGGRSILVGNYDTTWRLHRKLASKAVRYYMTGSRLEEGMERSLERAAKLIRQEKGAFNPHYIMSSIIFNIVNNMCFNFTCDTKDAHFIKMMGLFDAINDDFGQGFLEDFLPPLRLYPTKKMRKMKQMFDQVAVVVSEQLKEHKSTFSKDHVRDFSDAMLLAQLEAEEEEDPAILALITDRHLIQTVSDIFGAGLDTARYTLQWLLIFLSRHPKMQEKIQEEVDEAFGSRLYPLMSDRPNLPYTDAFLHEVFRIAPFTPLAVPHTALCDTTVGGYDIPKGTQIFINVYALHHDPRKWDEHEVFRPERFLDGNGKMGPKPESWLPFSAGRRVCMGESVAKPELHLLLAGIMRQFKVIAPSGKIPSIEHGGGFFNNPRPFEIIMESRF